MTDEELQTSRGMLTNLRNGSANFVGLVEAANLIEALLNEIDHLKDTVSGLRMHLEDEKENANYGE